MAFCFINVARKASEFSSLSKAIQDLSLPVQKASRVVSALKKDNVDQLVKFAINNSQAKIDREVARLNPRGLSLAEYVARHDPVKKAERAAERKSKKAKGESLKDKERVISDSNNKTWYEKNLTNHTFDANGDSLSGEKN